MLERTEVLDFLKRHRRELETRFSVSRIGLFGSVLYGTANEMSDVDILVELSSPTFDDYMDLTLFLGDHFKTPVELSLIIYLKASIVAVITTVVVCAYRIHVVS